MTKIPLTPEEKRARRRKHNEDIMRFFLAEFPVFEREYRFHPTRRWAFDYAWPEKKVALEMHGGIYAGLPSHTMATQRERDYEKGNEAASLGWRVLQMTYRMIEQDIDGARSVLRRALEMDLIKSGADLGEIQEEDE
jgi:very-short-patch-repair endonuclease